MRRLRWTSAAQRDLRAIITFYDGLAPGLGGRLVEDVARATTVLADHPHIGPTVAESAVRRWRASGTPFLLFYRPTATEIRILHVRDARSDWKPA